MLPAVPPPRSVALDPSIGPFPLSFCAKAAQSDSIVASRPDGAQNPLARVLLGRRTCLWPEAISAADAMGIEPALNPSTC